MECTKNRHFVIFQKNYAMLKVFNKQKQNFK
jgi:hypothetical protein